LCARSGAVVAAVVFVGCNTSPSVPHLFHRAPPRVLGFNSASVFETVPLSDGAVYLITDSGIWYVRDTAAQRVQPTEAMADSVAATFGADFDLTPTIDGRAYATAPGGAGMWLLNGPTARRVHDNGSVSHAGVSPAPAPASFFFAQLVTATEQLRACEDRRSDRYESGDEDDQYTVARVALRAALPDLTVRCTPVRARCGF